MHYLQQHIKLQTEEDLAEIDMIENKLDKDEEEEINF
jgi:hypothetical protein